MKRVSFAIVLVALALTPALVEASTAYDALRSIQATRGQTVMSQLIEVRGETGAPQPQRWTVLMADPTARSGIREFIVARGEIQSERTPLRQFGVDASAPTLDFSRLNLDSDGAFKVAESQAVRTRVGFNSVDYTLRSDESGAPIWSLRLFDYMGAPVGTLQVSAVDGKIVQPLQLDADARVITESARPRAARTPAPEPSGEPRELGGVLGFMSRAARTTADGVKNTSVRLVGTVEEVLTGERTIGQGDPHSLEEPTE